MEALFGFSSLCMFSHWSHPEDAVALPLALVRVDCYGSEARHLGDCLAEQISAEFTLYKHYHWRLVQLTILKSDKINVWFFLHFTYFLYKNIAKKAIQLIHYVYYVPVEASTYLDTFQHSNR